MKNREKKNEKENKKLYKNEAHLQHIKMSRGLYSFWSHAPIGHNKNAI